MKLLKNTPKLWLKKFPWKKKFDHNYHQAMLEVERDNCEEGIVVQEIQSGFTMHGRLLRPSMVGVSKKSENKKKNQKKD